MPPHEIACSAERIAGRIDALAAFTEKDSPWTRLVFSDEYRAAREWLRAQFDDAGLKTRIDDGGNLIGLRPAAAAIDCGKKIIIGSHIDTVPRGGRYDGIAGVVAALEIIGQLDSAGIDLPFGIEVIDFLGEELNAWGLSCLGSRHMAGVIDADMLALRDADGRVLGEAIKSAGGSGNPPAGPRADAGSVLACFELHIEQATRLENAGIDLGIVTAIPAIRRYALTVGGRASHSGATAMGVRQDALLAASRIICRVSDMAHDIAGRSNRHFVATVGRIEVTPNAPTVIAGGAEMILDVRAPDPDMVDDFILRLEQGIADIAAATNTEAGMELRAATGAAPMDKGLREALARAAAALDIPAMEITSGGGHDSAHLSRFAPAAMVFIPCRDGLSHCATEHAEAAHIAKGGDVIAGAVLDLAARV